MKQLSLTEARAQLSTLVAEVDKGKGPIAIAQRSKVKAVLVDPEWHGRVEEELAHYRRLASQSPLKLRGSMTLAGDLDEALNELKKEREQSLERLISRAQVIYVTDTHPLVFWSSNRKPRLGKRARRILQETEQGKHSIIVPVVVLEEINRLVERGVVHLAVPFRRWAQELERSPNFQVQPYTLEVLLESVSLVAIRDPADRAIVATARHLRCPLITTDAIIQEGDWVDTLWD